MPTREHAPHLQSLAAHLRFMRDEFPSIRPEQEVDDILWSDLGMHALAAGQLNKAERIFKKLTLAQPTHPDGYSGLAHVYKAHTFLVWARLFADEAIRLCHPFILDASMDQAVLDDYLAFRAALG